VTLAFQRLEMACPWLAMAWKDLSLAVQCLEMAWHWPSNASKRPILGCPVPRNGLALAFQRLEKTSPWPCLEKACPWHSNASKRSGHALALALVVKVLFILECVLEYERHFVGKTWRNVQSWGAKIYPVV